MRLATVTAEGVAWEAERLREDALPSLKGVDATLAKGAWCLDLMDAMARAVEHLESAPDKEAARACLSALGHEVVG